MRPIIAACCALTILALLSGRAQAGSVTGVISGQVTASGGSVPGVEVGDSVTGSYAYDPSVVKQDIFGPVNPFTAFSLTVGTNPQVLTLADLQGPSLTIDGRNVNSSTAKSDSLFFPFLFPVIDAFAGGNVGNQFFTDTVPEQFMVHADDPAHSFTITFTATSATAVPEPASLTLATVCLGGLALRAWRRKVG